MSNGQKRGLTARHMNDRITRPRPSEVVWTPERARVTAILRRGVTSRKTGWQASGKTRSALTLGEGGMHARLRPLRSIDRGEFGHRLHCAYRTMFGGRTGWGKQ
jgi:hypothetical protein